MRRPARPPIFYALAVLVGLLVVFLYGPIATVVVLAFQGKEGGLVFPMNGISLHWFGELFRPQSIGDIWGAFDRSIALGAIVMAATVLFSFLAGLAFRRRFFGATLLFYIAVASLVMPSVVVSLGIGSMFEILGIERAWWSSALGAHLTWTLPFGLLIMLAVFNRFNPAYEEAARDLGARGWQTIRYGYRRADHRSEPGRSCAVRFHPLLRRDRANLAIRRCIEHAAARTRSHADQCHHPSHLRLGCDDDRVVSSRHWRLFVGGCRCPRTP